MPNLSHSGLLAAFTAFGRAKVWPTCLLLGLIFSPLAVSASCESDVAGLGQALPARFVNFEQLEKLSDAQIVQEVARQESVNLRLQAERKSLAELYAKKMNEIGGHSASVAQINAAGIPAVNEKSERLEGHLSAVADFKDALLRVKERRRSGLSAAKAIAPLKIEIKVRGKSEKEVLNEIVLRLKSLGSLESLVLRYFSNARHDLTALHGTDNHGTSDGHRSLWDEQGMLTGILKEMNLQRDDGFHGAIPEYFFIDHEDAQKIRDGIGRIGAFMYGEQAIAVYDLGQLIDFEADFYVFQNPEHKTKAVRAILLPVDQ